MSEFSIDLYSVKLSGPTSVTVITPDVSKGPKAYVPGGLKA